MSGSKLRRIACGQLEACDLDRAPRALDEALSMVAAAGDAGADVCVLPEGTYPAYVLGSAAAGRAALAAGPDALGAFGDAARRARLDLVVGLVVEGSAGLLNAAVHFGPDGVERARAAKRFLWHFDRAWFAPGGEAPVAHGIGMLVCADGRLPEIAGGLARRGAGLLCNATAWVTSLPPPAGSNPQADFLWRVRALENGVAAAAATKVGVEAATTMYSGRSQIVAADGTVVAIASATAPELLVADVQVPVEPRPPRTDDVGGEATANAVAPPLRPGYAYVALLTHTDLLPALAGHGCNLVVLPDGLLERHDLDDDITVTSFENDDLLVPGPARRAATAGAAILVWMARRVSSPHVEDVARARALENRVFVAVWRAPDTGGPFIVSPEGRVLARAPGIGVRYAVAAPCLLAEAATKEMAPGTDAWAGIRDLNSSG